MPPSPSGLCWRCNYPLHSAFERKCPECGRAFDPGNPRTMNMGPPISRLTRFIVAATATLLYITGLPLNWVRPSPDELTYLFNVAQWGEWSAKPELLSITEWITMACVIVWALILPLCGVRWLMRMGVFCRHGFCFELTKKKKWRLVVVPLLFAVTCVLLLHGWPNRAGEAWAHRQIAAWTVITKPQGDEPVFDGNAISGLRLGIFSPGDWRVMSSPLEFTPEDEFAILRHTSIHGSRRARVAALGLLLALVDKQLPDALAARIGVERDAIVRVTQVRLLAMLFRFDDGKLFEALLEHEDSATRAAAADALYVRRHASNYTPFHLGNYSPSTVLVDPPITVDHDMDRFDEALLYARLKKPPAPSDEAKARLATMMTQGTTPEEREAAARVVVGWQPQPYKLRVAEWGVWISDDGKLKLAESVIDEIPPFVHRTGNPMAEFADRLMPGPVMFITKPIVHVYASEPMAVDMRVMIRQGRPWFAYPKPDDFALEVDSGIWRGRAFRGSGLNVAPLNPQGALSKFDRPHERGLTETRLGLDWLFPRHHMHTAADGLSNIKDVGLRWQSIIVTPRKPAWATLPVVGDDKRFQWWSRLREVPGSYVTSRGETERFLYYDGPTLAPSPVTIPSLDRIRSADEDATLRGKELPAVPNSSWYPSLLIECNQAGVSGKQLWLPQRGDFYLRPDVSGEPRLRSALREMLTDGGLNQEEADGLIDAWTPQFFQTPGRRVIVRMSRNDYDRLCPIDINPAPTELERVGLVLFELSQPRPGRAGPNDAR